MTNRTKSDQFSLHFLYFFISIGVNPKQTKKNYNGKTLCSNKHSNLFRIISLSEITDFIASFINYCINVLLFFVQHWHNVGHVYWVCIIHVRCVRLANVCMCRFANNKTKYLPTKCQPHSSSIGFENCSARKLSCF